MRYKLCLLVFSTFSFIQYLHSQNYKDATIVVRKDTTFIKLKGKRERMVHSPSTLNFDNTYEDSTFIPIPSLNVKIVRGENIPVKKGHYRFTGQILIQKQFLKIELSIDDTDDKVKRPYSWNGEYCLIGN